MIILIPDVEIKTIVGGCLLAGSREKLFLWLTELALVKWDQTVATPELKFRGIKNLVCCRYIYYAIVVKWQHQCTNGICTLI